MQSDASEVCRAGDAIDDFGHVRIQGCRDPLQRRQIRLGPAGLSGGDSLAGDEQLFPGQVSGSPELPDVFADGRHGTASFRVRCAHLITDREIRHANIVCAGHPPLTDTRGMAYVSLKVKRHIHHKTETGGHNMKAEPVRFPKLDVPAGPGGRPTGEHGQPKEELQ